MSAAQLACLKQFRDGTDRCVAPRETIARLTPLLSEFGISRVANVTGLDRIGVPVIAVYRPNGRSVSTFQGKGLTLDAAEASGLMEASECHHAEHATLPLLFGSANELAREHRLVDVTSLPRLSTSSFQPNLRLLWTAGVSLPSGERILIPHELVHTDYRLPLPDGSGAFLMSSNGLASGNHLQEAVSHAICELVERDANTVFAASGPTHQRSRRVALGSVDDPACRSVLERCDRAEVDIAIWETTTDIRLASYLVTLVDRNADEPRTMPPMSGSGCHPRRHIALLRALTEAAQGRLTVIAGSREGLANAVFDRQAASVAAARTRDEWAHGAPTRRFADAPDADHPSVDADVAFELAMLERAGIVEVAAVNLTHPRYGIPVVRLVAPGLEAMSEVRGYVPGARARRALLEGSRCS